jgi:hypothetical protein
MEPIKVRIAIQDIVTTPTVIAVHVAQGVVECQKPESLIHIQVFVEFRIEFFNRRLGQCFADTYEFSHSSVFVARFQFVAGVSGRVVAVVFHSAATTPSCSWHLPAIPAFGSVPVASEVLVHLLNIEKHSPALAVDNQSYKIRVWGCRVFASDVVVKHFAHE